MLTKIKSWGLFLVKFISYPIVSFLAWRQKLRDEEGEKLKQENEILKRRIAELANSVSVKWTPPPVSSYPSLHHCDCEDKEEKEKKECRRPHSRELSDSELMGEGEDP